MQIPSGHCRCKKTQTPSRHEPKTAQTASQKTVSRYLWNPHKTIFGATEHMPSLCKHHLEPHKTTFGATVHMPSLCKHHMLDTADAKRPKHHLDTSRKPPKPQAKKLFHGTFGIHINNLWSHRAHAQPMQTPSGHCRCKKTQTPSRHEPKTAQTASQKTVSRYLWNPHKTIFGATEHKPSLCKHNAYANTIWSRKPLTASQKTVSRYLWNPHKTIFGATEHMPSLCKHHLDHEPKTAQTASQKTVSRYLWNPHKTIFGATEHTICKLEMQKDPNTI